MDKSPIIYDDFAKVMMKVEDVYMVDFPKKTLAAWFWLFKNEDPAKFEEGVMYMFKNATRPAPKWIYEGIHKFEVKHWIPQ